MLTAISILSYVLVFALLFSLALRDLKEYLLPDVLNLALLLSFVSFHISISWDLISPIEALAGAAMGGGLLLLIRTLANRFYHEDSLGLGDVKLMTAAGFGLGYPEVLMAITFGAFVGLLHGIGMAIVEMQRNKSEFSFEHINVPAGVGLTIGIGATMVYQFGLKWLIL